MSFVPPEDIPTWIPACAILWLLASVWKGWTRGIIRQAVSLCALALGIATACYVGPLLAPVLPAIGFPKFLRPLVAGGLIALLVWVAITAVSSIVFRKTDEQGVGLVRTAFGLGGAILGLFSGLLLLGVGAWSVRLAGSLADGLQKGARNRVAGKSTTLSPDSSPLPSLKKMVEDSPLSPWISKVDPVSPDWYPRLGKVGQVLTSPSARDKLLSDPSFAAIAKNPRLGFLRDDPALQEALRSADLWTLLRSPKVQAAAADTQLLTALRLTDVDAALDRALAAQPRPPENRGVEPRRLKP